jgi:hypothetical protein
MLREWPTDKTACPTSPPPLSEDLGEELGARERRKVNYMPFLLGGCARSLAAGQKLHQPNRPEM